MEKYFRKTVLGNKRIKKTKPLVNFLIEFTSGFVLYKNCVEYIIFR